MIDNLNKTVWGNLSPTDYIDIRNLRDPNYKVDWMLWREQIRNQASAQADLINACADVAALAALPNVEWAHDPNWVAPAEVNPL